MTLSPDRCALATIPLPELGRSSHSKRLRKRRPRKQEAFEVSFSPVGFRTYLVRSSCCGEKSKNASYYRSEFLSFRPMDLMNARDSTNRFRAATCFWRVFSDGHRM